MNRSFSCELVRIELVCDKVEVNLIKGFVSCLEFFDLLFFGSLCCFEVFDFLLVLPDIFHAIDLALLEDFSLCGLPSFEIFLVLVHLKSLILDLECHPLFHGH